MLRTLRQVDTMYVLAEIVHYHGTQSCNTQQKQVDKQASIQRPKENRSGRIIRISKRAQAKRGFPWDLVQVDSSMHACISAQQGRTMHLAHGRQRCILAYRGEKERNKQKITLHRGVHHQRMYFVEQLLPDNQCQTSLLK
jgi:hypothetical protein